MLMCTVFLLTVSACLCAQDQVPILSEEIVVEHDGKFHWSYEAGDGTKAHESGDLKQVDKDHAGEAVQGGFEYLSPEGLKVEMQYIADENGYQPQGNLIPVPPPVPEAIVRALKYIAEHPTPADSKP